MDLMLAALIVVLASLLALLGGMRIGQSCSVRCQSLSQIAVVIMATFYFAFLWDRPLLTRLLPHTAVILLGNWHAVMGSFFVGVYLTTPSVAPWPRLFVGPATLVLACYSIVAPVIGSAPECAECSSHQLLITQTTDWTCSPAAGASLLRLYGIDATEAQMAELCLTRKGTHWQGLYRGLKLMTASTGWDVVAEPYSAEAAGLLGATPAILSVNIDSASLGPSDHGFHSSAGHTVLALRSRPAELSNPIAVVTVFDPSPSYGIESWGPTLLNSFSDGVILRLVPRDRTIAQHFVTRRIRQALMAGDSYANVLY